MRVKEFQQRKAAQPHGEGYMLQALGEGRALSMSIPEGREFQEQVTATHHLNANTFLEYKNSKETRAD